MLPQTLYHVRSRNGVSVDNRSGSPPSVPTITSTPFGPTATARPLPVLGSKRLITPWFSFFSSVGQIVAEKVRQSTPSNALPGTILA